MSFGFPRGGGQRVPFRPPFGGNQGKWGGNRPQGQNQMRPNQNFNGFRGPNPGFGGPGTNPNFGGPVQNQGFPGGPGPNGPNFRGPGPNGAGFGGPGPNGAGFGGPSPNGTGFGAPGPNGAGFGGPGPNGPGFGGPGPNGPGFGGPGPGPNAPVFGGPGPRPMMGPGMGGPPVEDFKAAPDFDPEDVMIWLEDAHPMVIKNVMGHCRWILEQRGIPLDDVMPGGGPMGGPPMPPADMSGWYADGAAPGMKRPSNMDPMMGGPDFKKRPHPGFGWGRQGPAPGNLQWTPAGWVPKDNSHKVTTKMKPLPEPEVIPPNGSANYPEAAADRDKLKMLGNNLNMMSFEMTKICKTFKINDFSREKISTYPEEAQSRLTSASTCVEKAEQTLTEFKEFLKTEKYKEWNEEQTKKHEDAVKSMIGEMPSGVPHNSKYDKTAKSDENEKEES